MVIPRAPSRSSLTHVAVVVAALWLNQSAVAPAFAFVDAAEASRHAGASDERHPPGEPGAADLPAKNQALTFAFVMLGCIIVGGAMLLALVVIWGNRTRRLAQSPLPPIAKRDELWFLKPKKESPEGTAADAPNDPHQDADGER
jgi:hypothetical protein